MSFTALKRRAALSALLASSSITIALVMGAAVGADKESTTAVVARLYKDFAWQAIIASPDKATRNAFGKELSQQSKAALDNYLDPTLTSLLLRDADCTIRTHEICRLDFDPVFAAQDSGAADLAVEALAPGRVSVEFNYPSNGQKIRLEYKLVMIAGKWKISDIIYGNMDGVSLREILTRKSPSQ